VPEMCKTCRFWKAIRAREADLDMSGGPYAFPTIKYVEVERMWCVRFPKREETTSDHYCGEHQPIPAEPENVTTTGDIRYA